MKPLSKHDLSLLAKLSRKRWTFLRDSSWPRARELEGQGLVESSLQVSRMTHSTIDHRLAHRLTVAGLATKQIDTVPVPSKEGA